MAFDLRVSHILSVFYNYNPYSLPYTTKQSDVGDKHRTGASSGFFQ